MNKKFEKLEDKDIIRQMKRGLDLIKISNDTLYVMPDDYYDEVENISEEEDLIATLILRKIGCHKNDEELIEFNIRANQLFNLLIHLQRKIITISNLI